MSYSPKAKMTDWVAFTPTGSWTNNCTYAGKWRRVGDTLEILYTIYLTGAPNATALYFDPPAGINATLDDSKAAVGSSGGLPITGLVQYRDNGVSDYNSSNIRVDTTSGANKGRVTPSTSANASITNTVPFTWANGDFISVSVSYAAIFGG